MAKKFHVSVVAPEGPVWDGEADFLVARSIEGEIGILADHEPVMAALATGAVSIEADGEKTLIGVHGGFLQVLANTVTLLTDRAQIVEGDTDEARKLAEELAVLENEEAELTAG